MTKFLLKKQFSLAFLGAKWKEKKSFITFNAFTIKDIRERLPELSKTDEDDSKSIEAGIVEMIKLLQSKFIAGKGISEKGEEIDIAKGDLEDLPIEVISKAVDFLSQGLTGETAKP